MGRKNSRHLSKMIMIYDDKLIYYDYVYDYKHLINHKLRQKSLMLSPSLFKHPINHAFLLGVTHHERTMFQKLSGKGSNMNRGWDFFSQILSQKINHVLCLAFFAFFSSPSKVKKIRPVGLPSIALTAVAIR